MPNNQLVFAEIAAGNVDSTGASPADKLQGAQGCTAVCGGTGIIQVTMAAPNDGLGSADLIVQHNPGFGSAKAAGGLSTTLSSLSNGVFLIEIFDQTTVPPALINGAVMFVVKRKYQNT